ncbi:Cell Wall Hydrolase [compost metagenome]
MYLSGAKPIPFREFAQAQIAADQVLAGKVPDPTGGATHYYATTMPKPPVWAKSAKQTLMLGHHVFFKDVP